MADMKPFGVDQTTGQERPVKSTDSLVNNIGNQVKIAVTNVGDYSGGTNNVRILHPWTETPTRLDNPSTLLTTWGIDFAWSPGDEYLAAVTDFASGRSLTIYKRSGNTFEKLSDPSSAPPVNAFDIEFSPDGEFLAIAASSQDTNIYQRNGDTHTLLASPASMTGGDGVAWSPNGEILTTVDQSSGHTIFNNYRRDGTSFTFLPKPASLPASGVGQRASWSPCGELLAITLSGGTGLVLYQRTGLDELTLLNEPSSIPFTSAQGISWSPNGQFLAVGVSPGPRVYSRSGTSFTLLAAPATGSTTTGLLDWSPDGKYLAAASIAGGLRIFEFDGTTLTRLPDPASLPAGGAVGVQWSNDHQFLVAGDFSSPYMSIYQTDTSMPDSGIIVI